MDEVPNQKLETVKVAQPRKGYIKIEKLKTPRRMVAVDEKINLGDLPNPFRFQKLLALLLS